MSDRENRYAEAMLSARWPNGDRLNGLTTRTAGLMVPAVMAVADEERAADRAEIERLRKSERTAWAVHREHVDGMGPIIARHAGDATFERVRADSAESRLDALVADLRGLADDLAVEIAENRGDLPPVGPGRIAHIYRTAGLSDAHDRLRAVLDKHAGEQP